MNAREWARYLTRHPYCLHCGTDDETISPHHRINRQAGGSAKASKRNQPSNIIPICSAFNGIMESDPDAAQEARARGWKLASYENPLERPVWDVTLNRWYYLDDAYNAFECFDWDELP